MSTIDAARKHATSEIADRLSLSVMAGQPVTTKLIVSDLLDYLKDEDALADMARRALIGENVFGLLVRNLIQDEAELISQAAIAALPEAA